jgi:hypothetical protein
LGEWLSGVRAEEQMHDGPGTPDLALGARSCPRSREARPDRNPENMCVRRETVEHPFGTIKSWMGAAHFQMKTLKHVGTEIALHRCRTAVFPR